MKEVAAAKDDDLSKQLLETAVHNFGENPIRLYDKHKDEHVLPVEAFLAKVKDDGTWGRLIDLIKALTPERKH